MKTETFRRRHLFAIFAIYLLFVIYGSLIPFQYRNHTFAQAIQQFAAIGYLDLGITSRADWIANIVLYIPLSFFGCAWLTGMAETRNHPGLRLCVIFSLCGLVATAVEFTQIFFSPRTVSLNDLIAEGIGTFAGVAFWAIGRRRISKLREAFAQGGQTSVLAVGTTYAAIYLALSLFPYDFIISANELAWKWSVGRHGWLIAPVGGSLLRTGAKLAIDAMAIAPIGLLLALSGHHRSLKKAFLVGGGIGLVLEILQFFLASGTSQGASILCRGAGLAAGVAAGRMLADRGSLSLASLIWRLAAIASIPYIAAVIRLAGWFSISQIPSADAIGRLGNIRFLPFYYHYFSTESAAMASLLANAALYAPLGMFIWAWQIMSGRDDRKGFLLTAICTLCLVMPVEFGKLWFPPKHPDPTNFLIGLAGATFARSLAAWCGRVVAQAPHFWNSDRENSAASPRSTQPISG